jgi:hypothetical protein
MKAHMADTELFDLIGKYAGLFIFFFVTPALGAYLVLSQKEG